MFIVLDRNRRQVFRGSLSGATTFLLDAYSSLDDALCAGMRIEPEGHAP